MRFSLVSLKKGGSLLRKKVFVLMLIGMFALVSLSFANPFATTQESTTTVDFSAVGTAMQNYFADALPTIVIILGISIGIPWAIKMFRRAAR